MPFSLLTPPLRTVTGVVLTLQADSSWQADCCRLHRHRDTVTVGQQLSGLASVAALRAALVSDEPAPLALVLAGRGVLWRTLPAAAPDHAPGVQEAVAAALPGVNPGEFYVQYQPNASSTHLALIRQAVVDQLLAELHAADLWVVALSLGPASFEGLLPYLPEQARHAPQLVGDFRVQLAPTGEALAAVDYQAHSPDVPAAYTIGQEVLSSAQVLPYAAALQALVRPPDELPALPVPRVAELASEWGHRQRFLQLRLAVPLAILALLLLNFFLSQHFAATRDQLATRLGSNQQLLQQVRQLQQTVGRKHTFLTTTGWAQPSWNGLCADRLAASVPTGITLLTVDLNPLQAAAGGAERQVSFHNGLVTVKGQCHDSQRLNEWLQQVTKQPWVRAVRDQNFTYDYAGGLGTFTFTLVINPAALLG